MPEKLIFASQQAPSEKGKKRCGCETHMPPTMANSKDSHSHKDKYVDTSRKILEYSSELSKL